jgi:hypothetical protein
MEPEGIPKQSCWEVDARDVPQVLSWVPGMLLLKQLSAALCRVAVVTALYPTTNTRSFLVPPF